MRAMILTVVALAACSSAGTLAVQTSEPLDPAADQPRSSYQSYRAAREAALTGKAEAPTIIPVALPVKAPTAAEIAPAPAPAPRSTRVAQNTAAPVGPAGYARKPVSDAEHMKACGRFYSDAAAQEAFIRAGGPTEDPAGLDPDGDGYACEFRPQTGL